jgi:hypothetical protein
MRVLSENEIQIGWDDIAKSEKEAGAIGRQASKPHPRDTGIPHVGTIIRQIAIRTGVLKANCALDEDILEEDMPLRMALGMAWERWVATLHSEMTWQPGEIKHLGIAGNLDGLSNDARGLYVNEFKCTWKSMKKGILAQQLWLWQGMAYAYMVGACRVEYHIFWVNGDWKPPTPRYRTYMVEFSRRELENNWRMLERNKGG